jgi:D-amino-acid dehydrogenase
MYAPQAGVVRRPTLWAERYMVVSPMADGIRMTSIKELTATGSAPRFGFIHRRDADARTLFPALSGPARSEWAGLRPCTPDSLPVIDTVDGCIHVACGHGHLGITQGPTTGVLVAQSIAGEAPSIPMSPYRADRFDGAFATGLH